MPLINDPAINTLTRKIIGAAIEVHKHLGPGLLESIYVACLVMELRTAELAVLTKLSVPVIYKGVQLSPRLELDIVVSDTVVVEVKAIEALAPVHEAQLLTYLKLARYPIGLLINFNVPLLKDGVSRVINTLRPSVPPC